MGVVIDINGIIICPEMFFLTFSLHYVLNLVSLHVSLHYLLKFINHIALRMAKPLFWVF